MLYHIEELGHLAITHEMHIEIRVETFVIYQGVKAHNCPIQMYLDKKVCLYSIKLFRRFLSAVLSQGHLREGKCHLSLGNAMAASRCFQRVLEMESDNSQAQQEVNWLSDSDLTTFT